ncbi:hypothetical protein HL653_06250 [Sphingomonas sp. AP4-R1]|uniref:DUF6468 domain-containing protein n=1 Tax=Sphingomonas sp. AP4-R1 TaxID=2735134 RepID=UPI001493D173|nr:DUF6468 domain-containing protein [Sphingomonas sp. AP4-R1]QJU57446.1 hypothetical protein HL653_06250 [Sphingomonas sp. AP4-R1]
MSLTIISNIVVSILCVGVLIQVTRMSLALRTLQRSDIGETVAALDHATARATATLAEFQRALAAESAANHRSLSSGEALRDELSVMVGVGNNIADRIMEAAATVATPHWAAVPEGAGDEGVVEDSAPDEGAEPADIDEPEREPAMAGGGR